MSLIKDPRKTLHGIHNRVTVNVPMATIDLDYIVRHLDYRFISEHVDLNILLKRLDIEEKVAQALENATPEDIEVLIGSKLPLTSLSDVIVPDGHLLTNGDIIQYDAEQGSWVVTNDVHDVTLTRVRLDAGEF